MGSLKCDSESCVRRKRRRVLVHDALQVPAVGGAPEELLRLVERRVLRALPLGWAVVADGKIVDAHLREHRGHREEVSARDELHVDADIVNCRRRTGARDRGGASVRVP